MSTSEEASKQDKDVEEFAEISFVPISTSDDKTKLIKIKEKKKKRNRRESKQRESGNPLDSDIIDEDSDVVNLSTTEAEDSNKCYPCGGQICALCYCGEKSLLGQGDLTRYSPTPGFNPFKKPPLKARGSREFIYASSPVSSDSFEKVTKTAAVQRRSKDVPIKPPTRDMNTRPPIKKDNVDELSNVGCSEVLDVGFVFEPSGHTTAHHCCAAWSEGVTQNENYNLLCVDKAVQNGMSQRCHYCSQYGATIKCKASKCEKLFHYPCAAGSGCFQDIKSMSLLCTTHLELAPNIAVIEELNCAVCDDPGEIAELLFCTSCGHHYHGDCLDPNVDVNPVVRAGWQCPECKICQTCRQPGDDNKMLVCDVCDKGYHTFCLKPAMTFIPKNGWCCKTCRRCKDCGSRTPGNGPSSKWHSNYQICDPCYQLRNKGSICPICEKAYRSTPSARSEMVNCMQCKKWIHLSCESEQLGVSSLALENPQQYKCSLCSSVAVDYLKGSEPQAISVKPLDATDATGTSDTTAVEVAPLDQSSDSMNLSASTTQMTPTGAVPLKRSSTSSSAGSDAFALKGSSLDPMLYDEDAKPGQSALVSSPTLKVRTPSSETNPDRKRSTESNSNISMTFDSTQDSFQLFAGDSSLPSPGLQRQLSSSAVISDSVKKSPKFSPLGTSETSQEFYPSPSSDSKLFSQDSVMTDSPPIKPPGPGMGKPVVLNGKPLSSKKKPGIGKSSKGKGKGFGSKGKGNKNPSTTRRRTTSTFGRSSMSRRQRKQTTTSAFSAEASLVHHHTSTNIVYSTEKFEDEYGDSMHNTVVLCSSEDTYTLCQDMCAVCGSFGRDEEGRLIACSQCGQCYHPYCVNLKLSKVVLRKGWRCLDCTVCEECGDTNDPAHLLLCDDCDISYHTHCLSPPLLTVPKGGWKCKWCVRCLVCNNTSPGVNCEWMMNYTACGPCSSLTVCPKCKRYYKDEDIIMQCETCARWIHSLCENLCLESDIEKVVDKGYNCMFCRPPGAPPPHLLIAPLSFGDDPDSGNMYAGRTRSEAETVKEYQKDFTSLTVTGYQHIQKQMQKYMGMSKKRPGGPRRQRQPPKVVVPKEATVVLKAITITDANYSKPATGAAAVDAAAAHESETNVEKLNTDDTTSAMDSSFVSPDKTGSSIVLDEDASKSEEADKVKRKRKPYRPGIGGFTIRQRGRGSGVVKNRGSRHALPSRQVIRSNIMPIAEASLSLATPLEPVVPPVPSVSVDAVPPQMSSATIVEGGATQPSLTATTVASNETNAGLSLPPFKLKLPSSKPPKRKRRAKLIDQFPQYLQDAFFGKHVITQSKKKQNPLEGLNESTSMLTPSTNEESVSRVVLPEKLTQRIASHTDRHQQEDETMGDKETEEFLKNLHLPDLDKMDIDQLDIGSDFSQIFNEVLTHDSKHDEHTEAQTSHEEATSSNTSHNNNEVHSAQHDIQHMANNLRHGQQPNTTFMQQAMPRRDMPDPTQQMSQIHMPPTQVATQHVPQPEGMNDMSNQQAMPQNIINRPQSITGGRQPMPLHAMPHVASGMSPSHQATTQVGGVKTNMGSESPMVQHSAQNVVPFHPHFQQRMPQHANQYPDMMAGQQTPQRPNMPPQEASPTPSIGQNVVNPDLPDLQGHLPDLQGKESNIFEPSPRPWPLGTDVEGDSLSVNQRNILKWEKDEPLGELSTISPVLYANIKFPNLKQEYPEWQTRAKQVAKLWRKATPDERAPFLQKARDNRALLKSTRTKRNETSTEVKMENVQQQGQMVQGSHAPPPPQSPLHSPTMQPHPDIAATNIKQQFISTAYWPQQSPSPTVTQSPTPGTPGPSNMQWHFAKPRPPSRDATPRPQSPATPIGRSSYPMGMISPGSVSPRSAGPQWPAHRPAMPQGPFGQWPPGTPGHVPSSPQPEIWNKQNNMSPSPGSNIPAKLERQQSLDLNMMMTYDNSNQSSMQGQEFYQSKSSSLPCSPSINPQQMEQNPFHMQQQSQKMQSGGPTPPHQSFSPHLHAGQGAPQPIRHKVPDDAGNGKPQQVVNPDGSTQVVTPQSASAGKGSPADQKLAQAVPQSSPIRNALYHHAQRRARLVEQQSPWSGGEPTEVSRPPPPYPGPGMPQTLQFPTQTQHDINQQGQVMQFSRGFAGGMPPVPGQQTTGFPTQQGNRLRGPYIELVHSSVASDPAQRRQEIMRIGSLATPAAASAATSENHQSDLFSGTNLPKDEHIDALLTSDQFKDLHFQSSLSTSVESTTASSSTSVVTTQQSNSTTTTPSTPPATVVSMPSATPNVSAPDTGAISVSSETTCEPGAQLPSEVVASNKSATAASITGTVAMTSTTVENTNDIVAPNTAETLTSTPSDKVVTSTNKTVTVTSTTVEVAPDSKPIASVAIQSVTDSVQDSTSVATSTGASAVQSDKQKGTKPDSPVKQNIGSESEINPSENLGYSAAMDKEQLMETQPSAQNKSKDESKTADNEGTKPSCTDQTAANKDSSTAATENCEASLTSKPNAVLSASETTLSPTVTPSSVATSSAICEQTESYVQSISDVSQTVEKLETTSSNPVAHQVTVAGIPSTIVIPVQSSSSTSTSVIKQPTVVTSQSSVIVEKMPTNEKNDSKMSTTSSENVTAVTTSSMISSTLSEAVSLSSVVPETPTASATPHEAMETSNVPTSTVATTSEVSNTTAQGVTPPRKRPLLIKEQPLLLQDLVEKERQEQERAKLEKQRQSQMIIQQQPVVPMHVGFHPPPQEIEKPPADPVAMETMKQTKPNLVAQPHVNPTPAETNLHVVAPQRPHATPHTPQVWPIHSGQAVNQAGMAFGAEGGNIQQRYDHWLVQHQAMLQRNIHETEKLLAQKRQNKKSLQQKQRSWKKQNREILPEDLLLLQNLTKLITEKQQLLEKSRNDLKQHMELVQEYNLKQQQSQHMIGNVMVQPTGNVDNQTSPMKPQQGILLPQQPGVVGNQPHLAVQQFPNPGNMQVNMMQTPSTTNHVISGVMTTQQQQHLQQQQTLMQMRQQAPGTLHPIPGGMRMPRQIITQQLPFMTSQQQIAQIQNPQPGQSNPFLQMSMPQLLIQQQGQQMTVMQQQTQVQPEKPKRKRRKKKKSEDNTETNTMFQISHHAIQQPQGQAIGMQGHTNMPQFFLQSVAGQPANYIQNPQMQMLQNSALRMHGPSQHTGATTSIAFFPTLSQSSASTTATQHIVMSSGNVALALNRQHIRMPVLPASHATTTQSETTVAPTFTISPSAGAYTMSNTSSIATMPPNMSHATKGPSGAPVTVVTATSTQPTIPTAIQVKNEVNTNNLPPGTSTAAHASTAYMHSIATPECKLTDNELDLLNAQDPDLNRSCPLPRTDHMGTPTMPAGEVPIKEEQKPRDSIDAVMDTVVQDGVKYSQDLENAQKTGEKVTPPSWLNESKPTQFQHRMMMHGHSMGQVGGMANNNELLKHLMRVDTPGQYPMQHGMMNWTPEQQEQLRMAGHVINPGLKMSPDAQKKKRSRKPSKDVGDKKDGKRRRSKNKNSAAIGGQMIMSSPPGMAAGGMIAFPNGAMVPGGHQMLSMSDLQASMANPSKQASQLPVLSLIEPEIKPNQYICLPKGSGIVESNGEKKYLNDYSVPDYYDLFVPVEDPQSPPTPPASSPPSPTPSNQDKNTGLLTNRTHPGTQSRLELDKDVIQHQSMSVRVPDSLPTPPHHGIDYKEDSSLQTNPPIETIPPSSPEMDEEDDWSLNSLIPSTEPIIDVKPLLHDPLHSTGPESPDIPLVMFPKINVPYNMQSKQAALDDKENVSVTIEFDNANTKMIHKSLRLLSQILGTNIINFNMEECTAPDLKNKALKNESNDQQLSNKEIKENMGPVQRKCTLCTSFVVGNGVRKPPPMKEIILEEDVIFCNKDCFLQHELFIKKPEVVSVKKKFKASHIYQRQTAKMTMEALLEKFPEAAAEIAPATRGQRSASEATGLSSPSNERQIQGDPKRRATGRRRGSAIEEGRTAKRWRGLKWKKWSSATPINKHIRSPIDVAAMLAKYGANIKPLSNIVDRRECVLCLGRGDGSTKEVARLLNVDVDKWVHLNCALWSAEVYETQGGALINVDLALQRSESVFCCLCQRKGATLHCHRPRCTATYHCKCAIEIKCAFFKDKTVLCPAHAPTNILCSNDMLQSLAVFRKVYVQRPETKQMASIMQQGELTQGEKNYVLRVGSLIFSNVGQLSTHQMEKFHSKNAIYPIGFKATRIYWSSNNHRRRCRYNFSVTEKDGSPWFTLKFFPALPGKNKSDSKLTHDVVEKVLEGPDVNELCKIILLPLKELRSQHSVLKLFPDHINGERLFGFTTPMVARILESLPNIELCNEYKFRFGRSPLLELPLAINPTGSARSEPYMRQSKKKPHTLISNLISEYYESTGIGDVSSLYGKQFVHCKSSQYRKMKQEWKQNVYLARSRIQGLGLYAARDIEPGTMVIEYIGDIIRTEVSEKREKQYELANRGVYMFRLDSDHIVDATVSGGPARYINHSCSPNCVAEVVNFEKEKKIMIISHRNILKGEELCYDYKFDFEDESQKIPCLCGAANCKKWMN